MTSTKIRIEENGRFQFDFSALSYVWEFHDVVAKTALSDVDFITETSEEVFLSNIKISISKTQRILMQCSKELSMKCFIPH